MQVQQLSNQNFGMALKCYPSLSQIKVNIALKHGYKKTIKSDEILKQLSQNRALTNLYLENDGKKNKLVAEVGNRVFKENWFNSPYRVLKKALKTSKEESKLDLIANVIKILAKDID